MNPYWPCRTRPQAVISVALIAVISLAWSCSAVAQDGKADVSADTPQTSSDSAPEQSSSPSDPRQAQGTNSFGPSTQAQEKRRARMLASPQATVTTLFDLVDAGDPAGAAMCLDLSEIDPTIVGTRGPHLAQHLREVLAKIWDVDLQALPNDPNTPSPYFLASDLNTFNTLVDVPLGGLPGAAKIKLIRNEQGLWQFSPETVAAIEDLHDQWYDKPFRSRNVAAEAPKLFSDRLRDLFPKKLQGTTFLIKDYQWICLLILIFLGFVADMVSRFILHRIAATWFRVFRGNEQYEAQHGVFRPMGLLVQALVWYAGTTVIGLPDFALSVLLLGLKFFAAVAAVWSAYRIIDLIALELADKASQTNTKFDDLLIPLVSRSLKVLAVVVGALACAEAFNLPITGLLGGLGIGGAALALASKDTISNVFGSLTVLVDRPFEIGDWIVTNDVEGTVEAVGFRSTRVRTFYNSLITLPNSLLTTASVDNMGRRRYRRVKQMIGLQYDTRPEQVEAFCEGIRELLRRHPYTRKDYYHVYLNEFSASSIDILLYAFLECPDWSIELRERHRLMLDIMRLAEQLGCSFAFPTRTLHMHTEPAGSKPPVDIDDPLSTGQGTAARIAGPYLSPDQRPGGVHFPGPAHIEEVDVRENGEGQRK